MPELPLVRLTGSPAERGRQHGSALADRIANNIDLYKGRMADDAGLAPSEVAERVGLYLRVFTELDPRFQSMMEGIAEGSRQSLADVVMLNARFELLYSAWSAQGEKPVPADCTGFGADGDVTADGRRVIGQNWDWFPGVAGALVTWQEDDDVSVLGYTEAGIAGAKIGVNSAGIGLCVNGLGCDADDWSIGGMPYHLRTTRILTSRKLTGAVGHASVDRPSCSANYLIGSAADGVVDVESSPVGSRRINTEPGRVMVHANHFVEPEVLGVTETWRTWPTTTFHRHARLSDLLNSPGDLDTAKIRTALRDHDGDTSAVCRHPDESLPEHLRTHTAFSVIIDMDEKTLAYTDGPPCESEYVTVGL